MVDVVDSARVCSSLLPSFRQIQRTREVPEVVNHCIEASTAMTISGQQRYDNLTLHRKRIVHVRNQVQSLISRVFQSCDGCRLESDTSQEPRPLLLVNLLVIPDRDGHTVCFAQEQVVVLVPFRIQRVLAGLGCMSLSRIIHANSHKGIRKPEQVSLGKIPGAENSHSDLD